MGEVGAIIPEKQCESPVATPAATVPLNGDINGVRKLTTTTESKSADETMEVDTEEDSQISSENGMSETSAANQTISSSGLKLPVIAKAESLSIEANSEAFLINNKTAKSPASIHSDENSRQNDGDDEASRDQQSNCGALEEDAEAEEEEHSQADENTRTSSATTNDDENSQDGVGDEDAKEDLSSQDNDVNMSAEGEETTNDNSNHQDTLDDENTQNRQNSEKNKNRAQENGVKVTTKDEKEKPQPRKVVEGEKMEVSEKEVVADQKAKENGEVNGTAKSVNDSEHITIIESDEEDEVPKEPPPPVPTNSRPISEQMEVDSSSNITPKDNPNPNAIPPTKASLVNDDTPVIIPSDSESDDDTRKPNAQAVPPIPAQTADEDMSGDDCVVIEDDDKSKGAADLSTRVPNRQRKSAVRPRDMDDDDDVTEILDDTPPSKKARTTPCLLPNQPQTLQIGQITIKDPRSLMQQFADPKSASFQQQFAQTVGFVPGSGGKQQVIGPGGVQISSPQGIFPNNMRPSLAPLSAPPKLVPTSPVIAAATPAMAISNSTLLPALTDDMFVLEAPSFIVPYIYEKPPCDNLKDLVVKLEKEIEKVREKIKEAKSPEKKGDDQEATAEEKATEGGEKKLEEGSKKKRKSEKGPDDSWDEQDTSTDDEASDGEPRTKVLIKDDKADINAIKAVLAPADTAKGSPAAATDDKKNDPKNENYFESPLGKFFVDIGINLVQEYVQTDLLKIQKRKLAKSMKSASAETELAVRNLQKNIEASKKRNEPYKFEVKRCEFCNFKTESALVMAHHYETPHMRQYLYKCNLCAYETRPAHDILFHMEAVHNVKGRLEKALAYNQCPNCPFEENGKAKFARHVPVCAKKFRPDVNLQPPHDWEAPAKIPRFKARHGLVGTATAYQAMAAQTAAQKAQLAAMAARAAAPVNTPPSRNRGGRPPMFPRVPGNSSAGIRGNVPLRSQPPGVVLPTGYQITPGGQIIQVAGSNLAVLPNPHNTLTLQQPQQHQQAQNLKKNSGQQPSISITPLPRQPGNLSNAAGLSAAAAIVAKPPAAAAGMKPGQAPTGGKASFVICEICDGYIKDLEQLRNHMQWMHKVKIHPKMIHNRPPLNCQKCQFRFFTDQGLERHLLGSHGLVTSSMQEAANKGKDAGRCPVCGRMYQWKLLNHVSRDHHMTLKPAHLSYKCTVCTATFGMYKQFENHVYTAHSTVAKKAMDGKKNSGSNNSSPMAGGSNVSNLSGITVSSIGGSSRSGGSSNLSAISSGDSLLKPLKINDEITIIPQPASKSRVSNDYESYLVGKSVNKR